MDSKVFQKVVNEARVLAALRLYRGISRIDIARRLGLDRSTITNIVARLQKQGIITTLEGGESAARGGRKPILLGIEEGFGCVLGLEIQVKTVRVVVTDLGGTVCFSSQGARSKQGGDLAVECQAILRGLAPRLKKMGLPLLGVGIGVPGTVNPWDGVVLNSVALNLTDAPLARKATARLKVPVLVENDANCCAWGALQNSSAEGLSDFICVIMEHHTGHGEAHCDQDLGLGIVAGGTVYYGANYSAGELPGSLVPVTSKAYQNIYSGQACPAEKDYQTYFLEVFSRLELPVAVLNPSHLFLGGEFCLYRKAAEAALTHMGGVVAGAEVRFSETGEFEVAHGAASLFIERLFAVPAPDDETGHAGVCWQDVLYA